MNFMPLLQGAPQGGFGSFGFLIPMLLVFVIFYFLLIRPQKKEQQKTERMIAQLQKGDKIITIGGIHGVVSSTKEKTLIIKVDDNCKIEINRSAVGAVLKDEPPKPDFAGESEKKKPLFGKKTNDSENTDNASQNESK
ncbi:MULTISPECIES: preprotein translocase subunit YajC [unclassified Treponema]|uniref:preprotein translocase subunit YajC n=1 Tax=unclassified Treponema TaxID=2638727 RepID=UPI0020A466B0|nr:MULTISPECIES: preprotein translocase subunit YajC [unclassified Treponema]UTC66404.1 preprotein translocase subunit YajC [Treponema sp. OMZ 789]UTC69134.1 preprotein translocase subunit YajC [Treponema sp. OMZ 790]UTC71846.1 preprotein translocase subunit YajC [Treponema sp. OMZ 791]